METLVYTSVDDVSVVVVSDLDLLLELVEKDEEEDGGKGKEPP